MANLNVGSDALGLSFTKPSKGRHRVGKGGGFGERVCILFFSKIFVEFFL